MKIEIINAELPMKLKQSRLALLSQKLRAKKRK